MRADLAALDQTAALPQVILSSTLCDRWIGPGHGGHRTG